MQLYIRILVVGLAMRVVQPFSPVTRPISGSLTKNQKVRISRSSALYDRKQPEVAPTVEKLDMKKVELVQKCTQGNKPARKEVLQLVETIEQLGKDLNIGGKSATSGLLSGEWELLYSPEDATRSSPFFWAFRKAFPDQADQIYGFTDAIPAPVKEIGPAFQRIDLNPTTDTGRFVSKVKVSALGGLSSSVMTTRASIVGIEGTDGMRLKIETTKPEDSTVISTFFGPLGNVVNENAPPFPSGDALERVRPGSSQVIVRTTFCDEGLRISRDDDRYDDIYVWRRREFASYDFL